jgi:predicted AlkP superfamily pyrophosphatase or phosphodiesterase
MPKTCLIIIDGLRYDTAVSECGYLAAAVEAGQAKFWKMQSCLPTISAPLYETIHTGLAPVDHGIFGNEGIRPSQHPNVFSALKAAGRNSGVVGHSYFHTLYGGSAFDPFEHAEINDLDQPIPYARYYSMEGYCPDNSCMPSDIDLCAQTWTLAHNHAPDYLLLHMPACDTLGHWFTSDSSEYRIQAWKTDNALSRLIPRLRAAGFDVLVTADHGMNADGHHAGNQACLREVPFCAFSERVYAEESLVLDQRAIAPTILSLIGIETPESMVVAALTK